MWLVILNLAGASPVNIAARTGEHTGRSARDKFVVRDADTEDHRLDVMISRSIQGLGFVGKMVKVFRLVSVSRV